jgi:hypothetical protein
VPFERATRTAASIYLAAVHIQSKCISFVRAFPLSFLVSREARPRIWPTFGEKRGAETDKQERVSARKFSIMTGLIRSTRAPWFAPLFYPIVRCLLAVGIPMGPNVLVTIRVARAACLGPPL